MSAFKKVNSFNVLKMDMNDVSAAQSVIQFVTTKIGYIREIIQNTIISIKNNHLLEIFSENDTKLSIQVLTEIFEKNEKLSKDVKKTPIAMTTDEMVSELQQVIDKLSVIICGFGTTNILDLLFISFGTKFKNTTPSREIIKSKYDLIMKHVRPTGYKLIHWKPDYNYNNTDILICDDKRGENTIEPIEALSYECFDIDYEPKTLFQLTNSIRIIIQHVRGKKTLIINGILDDIHLECISNRYIDHRLSSLNEAVDETTGKNKEILRNIIDNLTLKDLLVYGNADIIKSVINTNAAVTKLTNTNMDKVTQEFLEMDIYEQRHMLLYLLYNNADVDVEYMCYLLYDLLNSVSGYDTNYQELIYNSFPWKIRCQMKDIVKYNINRTQEVLNKYEGKKMSLEQQICLLKTTDSVKEKAITKLKELNGRPDEFGIKIKQYLEGLVRIPFGIYKKEPVLSVLNELNADFKKLQDIICDDNIVVSPKKNYTLLEISNILSKLKSNTKDRLIGHIIKKTATLNVQVLNVFIKMLYSDSKKQKELLKQTKSSKVSTLTDLYQDENSMLDNIITKITGELSVCTEKDVLYQQWNSMCKIKEDIKSFHVDSKVVEDALENSIYSHNHAKKQIMKIIGQWMNGKQSGYCFGFEGSPGIGKTSIAKKGLTSCLIDVNGESRPFAFIAMGGSSSGSTLEGHGYTYVNSTWGRIVDILMDTKCMNPIIYIDELDKVSNTENGKEIIGILTHLIDPTQNESFQDKYFTGIDIDISNVLFIFSYNDAERIDKILLDRIHRIKFENLTVDDKMVIVRKYILPDINEKMGFDETVLMSDEIIEHIINYYTCEPGVRKLKEIIFDLFGEINLELLHATEQTETEIPVVITVDNIENKYLTKYKKISEKKIDQQPRIGIINGLWANLLGMGGIIPVQTSFFPSSIFLDLKLTGLQGDVMKESMSVAKTIAWSLTDDTIKQELLKYFELTKCQGLHIHCPDGSISKDGPSAGAAITTAIYSLLNKKHIKNDIAITGEINLSGEITAIGGLDIKISNGIRAGVKTFLYPKENTREFMDWKNVYKKEHPDIKFIEISTIEQIFTHVFTNDNITV
jgi:ATP-dependent Lon protease